MNSGAPAAELHAALGVEHPELHEPVTDRGAEAPDQRPQHRALARAGGTGDEDLRAGRRTVHSRPSSRRPSCTAPRSTATGAGQRDHLGERVEARDDELEVAGPAWQLAYLTGPGAEPVCQGVEAAGPVLGLLADDHPHGDPIGESPGPDPHHPGHVLLAVEPPTEPGEHHGGAPPDPVGPNDRHGPTGPGPRNGGTNRVRPPPHHQPTVTASHLRTASTPGPALTPNKRQPVGRAQETAGGGRATRPTGQAVASSGGPRRLARAPARS